MTLTYFTARSTKVAHAFEWKKLLKYDLKGKTCRKLTNGQNIYVYEIKCLKGVGLNFYFLYKRHITNSNTIRDIHGSYKWDSEKSLRLI